MSTAQSTVHPQLKNRAWLTLFVLCISGSLLMGGIYVCLGVYTSFIEAADGWSTAELNECLTVFLVAMSIFNIASGYLSEKTSPKMTILVGALLSAAGCYFASISASQQAFTLAIAVLGAGVGMGAFVPSITLITDQFAERQGLALGIFFASISIFSGLSPQILAEIIGRWGWRTSFEISAVCILLASSLILILPRQTSVEPDAKSEHVAERSLVSLVLNKRFTILTLIMTVSAITVNGVLFGSVEYLVAGGIALPSAVAIFGYSNLVSTIGYFVAGILADRSGPKPLLPIALLMQAVGVASLLVVFDANWSWIATVVYVVVWGLSIGVPSQLLPMVLLEGTPASSFPFLLGISTAVSSLVSSFAPAINGWAVQASGGSTFSLLSVVIATATMVPAILLLRK